MKKIQALLLVGITCFVFGCKSGWTSAERTKFIETCTTSAAGLGDKAKPYCECAQKKVEKKYPKSSEVDKLTEAETEEIAKACLK